MGRSLRITVAAVALALLTSKETTRMIGNHAIGTDFLAGVYHPAQAVVHGRMPYGDPRVPGPLSESVYPASAFVPFAWVGLMRHEAAVTVWLLLMTAAAAATLFLLGVRDIRCYLLWLLTPMMLSTIVLGNLTTLVILLLAITWRWRDRALVAAASLAAAIALKLFAAPLVIWMVATKRYRAAAYTAVATAVLILGAWASIGFAAIGRYPSIVSANDHLWSPHGPYLQGLLEQLHAPSSIALAAGVVAAALLLVAAWFAGDLGGFTLAACAAIVVSPVAWIGYAGLLIVPLAAVSPRWSRGWLLLLGAYVACTPLLYDSAAACVCTIALVALFVVNIFRNSAPPHRLARWTPIRPSSVSSAA